MLTCVESVLCATCWAQDFTGSGRTCVCQGRMATERARVGTKSGRIQSQKVSVILRGLSNCGGCGLLTVHRGQVCRETDPLLVAFQV